jgi:nucleotidyltransferase/DNA polymerase involved in DNA repair
MAVLYCTIPHFAASLARRDDPGLQSCPLILAGPERRVLGLSAEAAACGVTAGMPARVAHIRCPEARLLDLDPARCQKEFEALLQLLEGTSPSVEPHGWGAAYVDIGDPGRSHADAVAMCQKIGRAIRRELGDMLQPALGWDSSKFTAQAAARRTQPGHLLAITSVRERAFLKPLPVGLLPLPEDSLRRLGFLGLRTLGQYATLSPAAVWQQFGPAGRQAQRYARGQDDRPVVPRWQAPHMAAECEFETPLNQRERLLAALKGMVSPLLAEVRGHLQACGQVRLSVRFDEGSTQERRRTFLIPTGDEAQVMRALGQLADQMTWPGYATALQVTLEQIQDVVAEQLTLFPFEDQRVQKLRQVQAYLVARFGANRLRRAVLAQPGAPLPEWRAGWLSGEEP